MRHEKLSRDGGTDVEASLIRPVVLCGGSGTRLWPLSRPELPKQLLPLTEERTMLQSTVCRVIGPAFAEPLVVAGEAIAAAVRDQLGSIGAEPAAILLEPRGRNTAPAIALAASWLTRTGHDEVMLVLPSDHLVADPAAFHRAIEAALPAVHAGAIVSFGIEARGPETGYGYIAAGAERADAPGSFAIAGFFEKPEIATARDFHAKGYLWNAGIFLARASSFLAELRRFAPEVQAGCEAAIAAADADGVFVRPGNREFLAAPSVSIDVAVMERTARACVVPVEMGWSDLGSWDAVWEASPKDHNGNAIRGSVIAIGAERSVLHNASGLTVAAIGVQDLVVIVTPDSILIVPRDQAQRTGLAAAAAASAKAG